MAEAVLFVIAVLLHECGHIITASILNIPIISFNIFSAGAMITFNFSRTGYIREGAVHLGGAVFGLLGALFAYLSFGERAYYFVGLSVALSVVNLLPIRNFDGGGILKCVLSEFFLPDTVWRVCSLMSAAGVLLLWMGVLWVELRAGGNLELLIFMIGIMLGQMK